MICKEISLEKKKLPNYYYYYYCYCCNYSHSSEYKSIILFETAPPMCGGSSVKLGVNIEGKKMHLYYKHSTLQ